MSADITCCGGRAQGLSLTARNKKKATTVFAEVAY